MFQINYSIKGEKKTCWGVEKWSELTEKQFLPAVKTIMMALEKPEAKYHIPLVCSNIDRKDYMQFSQVQAAQLVASFDHLLDYQDLPANWMVPKLEIKQVIKNKYMPLQVLYGPGDKLKNLIFEEFIFAESMFDAYKKNNNASKLNQFIAILYRPKRKDKALGDVREPFNKHSVDQRAADVTAVDKATKLAIQLNYLGCKALLPVLYKDLFSTTDPNPTQGAAPGSFSWLDTAYRMVSHQPTELETLKGLNLHEVLASLNLKVRDNKALKDEMEAMRRKHTKR